MVTATQLIEVGAVGAISCFMAGISAFGKAILWHICWQILWAINPDAEGANDIKQIVALYRVLDVTTVVPFFFAVRRDVNWQLWAIILPTKLCAAVLGVYLLLNTPPAVLQQVLGAVFLAFALWRACLDLRRMAFERRRGFKRQVLRATSARPLAPKAAAAMPSEGESALQPQTNGDVEDEARAPTPQREREADQTDDADPPLEAFPPSDKSPLSLRLRRFLDFALPLELGREAVDPRTLSFATMSSGLRVAAVSAGFLSGLLDGMFGTGGPPLMVFVTLANLEKSGMRALVTALDVVDSPVIAAYQLGIAGDFRGSDWPRYVTLIATGHLGLYLGSLAHSRVDTNTVMRITLCLLMMASVAMLKPPLAFIVSWIALIGIAAAAIAVWWRWSGRRLLRQLTQRRLQRLQSAEAAAAVEQREEAEREDAVPLSHLGPGQQRA